MSVGRDITRIVSGELLKFRRRRSTVALPIVMVTLAIVIGFGFDIGARNNWFGLPSGFFVAASAIAWITNVFVLVLAVITAFTISQEFALGTVKAAWTRPMSRRGWFAGKVLTAGCAITVLYVLAVTAVVAFAAVRTGYTDLMEKDYLVHTSRSLALRLLLTTGLTMFALWSATVVTSALAAGLNHPGGAIAAALGLGVAMTALSVFPPLRPFLLTTYLGLPSEQMIAMSKGLPLPREWGELVWQTLFAGSAWGVAAYLLGSRIVARKEIKG
jgi:hypothetical protein